MIARIAFMTGCVMALAAAFALACGRLVEALLARRRQEADAHAVMRGRKGGASRMARRAAIALLVGCAGLSHAWLSGFDAAAAPLIAWALVGSGAACVIVACDVRTRIIPWECCAALAVAGCALGAYRGGVRGCVLVALVALGAWLVVKALAWLGRARGGEAIGEGDVRAVPACVLFLGTGDIAGAFPLLAGLLVSGVACCAVVLASLAMGKVSLHDQIPFGPFFSGWVYSGILAPPVFATLA